MAAGDCRTTSRSSSAGTSPAWSSEVGAGRHRVRARRRGLRLRPPPPRCSTARYAEYATAPERLLRPQAGRRCPSRRPAALPLAGLTALPGARAARRLRGGETLFVGGGCRRRRPRSRSSSRVARGARVIATASGAQPRLPARARGRAARPTRRATSPRACATLLATRGADAALDLFGGDRARAGLRRRCAAAAASSRSPPPPEPRDGRHEVHYIFVRPERLRPRRAHRAARRGRQAAPARRGGVPARAGRRRARAPIEDGPRARQARAQRPGLNSSVPIAPSSASVAPSVSTKKPTRGRAWAWS